MDTPINLINNSSGRQVITEELVDKLNKYTVGKAIESGYSKDFAYQIAAVYQWFVCSMDGECRDEILTDIFHFKVLNNDYSKITVRVTRKKDGRDRYIKNVYERLPERFQES